MQIYQFMPYNKVINQEIEHPIEYHVSPSARRITEQLLRHNIAERLVEEINNLCYYLREFIHLTSNSAAKVLQKLHICKKKERKIRYAVEIMEAGQNILGGISAGEGIKRR